MTAGFSSSTVQINEFDVLTGRDRLAFGHPGNRFFRQLCALSREAYQTAHKRSVKTEIIQSIIAQVKERDGRFLTLQDEGCSSSSRSSTGGGYITWIEMNAAVTHQKVSHSLRSGKIRASSDESSSSSSLPSLSASLASSSSFSGSSRSLASSLSKAKSDAAASSLPQLSLSQRSLMLLPEHRRRKDSIRNSLWDMHDFLSQSCPNLGTSMSADRIFQDLDKPFTDIHVFDRDAPTETEKEEEHEGSSSSEEEEELAEEERRCRIGRDSLCLFDAMLRDSFASVLPDMPRPSDLRFSFVDSGDLDDLVEV
jgi:hypothetical protein